MGPIMGQSEAGTLGQPSAAGVAARRGQSPGLHPGFLQGLSLEPSATARRGMMPRTELSLHSSGAYSTMSV